MGDVYAEVQETAKSTRASASAVRNSSGSGILVAVAVKCRGELVLGCWVRSCTPPWILARARHPRAGMHACMHAIIHAHAHDHAPTWVQRFLTGPKLQGLLTCSRSRTRIVHGANVGTWAPTNGLIIANPRHEHCEGDREYGRNETGSRSRTRSVGVACGPEWANGNRLCDREGIPPPLRRMYAMRAKRNGFAIANPHSGCRGRVAT